MSKKLAAAPVFQSPVLALSGSSSSIFVSAPDGSVDLTQVTGVVFEETDLPPSQVTWTPTTLGPGQLNPFSASLLSFDATPTYNPPAGASFAGGNLSITFLPEGVCPEVSLQSFYISDGLIEVFVKHIETKGLLKKFEKPPSKAVTINIY
jgi:hypothetical protein